MPTATRKTTTTRKTAAAKEAPASEQTVESTAVDITDDVTPHPETLNVHDAILAVKREVGAIKKLQRNDDQRYNFRGIDAILLAMHNSMLRYRLTITPSYVKERSSEVRQTKNGTPMNYSHTIIGFEIEAADGSTKIVEASGEGFDVVDKSTNKASTVALRTALLQTFQFPTDDPDPDEPVAFDDTPARQSPGVAYTDGDRSRVTELQEEVKAIWATVWEWNLDSVQDFYARCGFKGNLVDASADVLDDFKGYVKRAADQTLHGDQGTQG